MDFLVVPAAAFLKQPITSFYVFGFDQNIPKVRKSCILYTVYTIAGSKDISDKLSDIMLLNPRLRS